MARTTHFAALALVAATLFYAHPTLASDGYDEAATKATTACDEIRYNLGLANKFKEQERQIGEDLRAAQEEAAALRLATASSETIERRAALAALAAIQETKATTMQTEATAAIAALRRGTVALLERVARTIELRRLKLISLTPGHASTTTNTDTQPQEDTITTTNTAALKFLKNEDNCTLEGQPSESKIKLSDIQPAKLYKIKLAPDTSFAQGKVTLKAASKGTPATSANACASHPGFAGQSDCTDTNYLGATGSIESYNDELTDVDLSTTTDKLGECKTTAAAAAWGKLSADYTAQEVCHALKAKRPPKPSMLGKSYEQLIEDNEVAALIELSLTGKHSQEGKDKDATKTLIKKGIGTTASDYATNFVKFITEKEHSFQIGDDKISGKLTEIAAGPKAAKLLAYMMGKSNQQCQIRLRANPEAGSKTDAADKAGEKKDRVNTGKHVYSSFQNQTKHEKGQGRKWDNNSFKDSSFLVNKKLDTSMAAAFTALPLQFFPSFKKTLLFDIF
uniref:Variant surface glycoprotein 1125.536 n=1 Tax=Trypanosoma brucei TaxID=5691 RepID=A0A1J0R637_9TRYP|nr:variant surface glycoprotein 1125.536 [Trypanosoma brucei]